MVKASDPTIIQMLAAFDDCQSDSQRSYSSITNARASLQASWRSDEAAPTFFRAVEQWLAGFQKVRAGLDLLNGNMQEYRSLTVRTEADNTSSAGGWART